ARVAPEGQAPSAFRGPGLAAALGAFAHGPFQAQGSDEGWTAELPFGPRASRLTLTTAQRHEVLGHGLRVRLRLPVGGAGTAALARVTLTLNGRELARFTHSHFLGSWGLDRGALAFVSFFPNAAAEFGSGCVEALAQGAALRAKWADEAF